MRNMVKFLAGSLLAVWSMGAFAAGQFAVVDMQEIFHKSAQVKKIEAKLKKQSAADQEAIKGMAQKLEANIEKLKKQGPVASKKDSDALKKTISTQEASIREKQTQFQQGLYTAQNEAMHAFMQKVQDVVAKIAKKQKYDLVLPKNAIVYSKSGTDITDKVIDELD